MKSTLQRPRRKDRKAKKSQHTKVHGANSMTNAPKPVRRSVARKDPLLAARCIVLKIARQYLESA